MKDKSINVYPEFKGYEGLAGAIVWFAIKDYLEALRCKNRAEIKELEEFFRSEWFAELSQLDPVAIMSGCRSIVNRERRNNARKRLKRPNH